MTYDAFNKCCCSLTATSHVIQWGGVHVGRVGGKVFAICYLLLAAGRSLIKLLSPLKFQIFTLRCYMTL